MTTKNKKIHIDNDLSNLGGIKKVLLNDSKLTIAKEKSELTIEVNYKKGDSFTKFNLTLVIPASIVDVNNLIEEFKNLPEFEITTNNGKTLWMTDMVLENYIYTSGKAKADGGFYTIKLFGELA